MANGLKDIIDSLERQKTAIDRALDALREVDGASAGAPMAHAPAKRGRKPGSVVAAKPAAAPAVRKGRISPEGRKKLAEAMKLRWAAKRAGSAVAAKAARKAAKEKEKEKTAAAS